MQSSVRSRIDDPELVARRRAQLIPAAIKHFSDAGYHHTTVKEIADTAGVSAGLVYQYVPDKQDLLFIALQHIVQRNLEEIPAAVEGVEDPVRRLYLSVQAYTRVIAANREAVVLTYRETKSLKPEYIRVMQQLELKTNALIAEEIDGCVRAGYLTATNTELLVYRIIMGAHTWALKYWRLKKIVSLEQYTEENIHSCWTVLLTASGAARYRRANGETGAGKAAASRSKAL